MQIATTHLPQLKPLESRLTFLPARFGEAATTVDVAVDWQSNPSHTTFTDKSAALAAARELARTRTASFSIVRGLTDAIPGTKPSFFVAPLVDARTGAAATLPDRAPVHVETNDIFEMQYVLHSEGVEAIVTPTWESIRASTDDFTDWTVTNDDWPN